MKNQIFLVLFLIALLCFAALLPSCKQDEGTEKETESTSALKEKAGKLPAIYCNGNLYVSDGLGSYGEADMLPEGFTEYGAVAAELNESLPDSELEARDIAVGDIVFINADDPYAVYILTEGELYRYLFASTPA